MMGDDPPSLKGLAISQCIRFSAMIDDIGEMSYGLIQPVLAKMTPARLVAIEQAHPRIAAESDELWRDIIKREFPGRPLPQQNFRQTYHKLLEDKESQLDAARERLIRKQQQYENDRRQSAVITLTEAPKQRRRVGYVPQRASLYRSRSMQLVAKNMHTHVQLHRAPPKMFGPGHTLGRMETSRPGIRASSPTMGSGMSPTKSSAMSPSMSPSMNSRMGPAMSPTMSPTKSRADGRPDSRTDSRGEKRLADREPPTKTLRTDEIKRRKPATLFIPRR